MEDGKKMTNINVLYEDNHIIVVEKPYNVLSQGDSTGDLDLLTMVKNYIKEKYNKPGNVYLGLVHRLDRPTGGVMVFAKTSKAASRLGEQLKSKQMHKHYLCVVNGRPQIVTDRLIAYLKKDENSEMKHILVDENMHEIAKVYIWQNHNDKSSKKDPYSVASCEDYKAVYAKGPENNKQYDNKMYYM